MPILAGFHGADTRRELWPYVKPKASRCQLIGALLTQGPFHHPRFRRVPEGQRTAVAYEFAARLLGHNPTAARRLANLARRVKTNPRRQKFLQRHPEIAVFYSGAPGLLG